MGKLAEYLKLIPAGLKNLNAVVEGYTNDLKMENGTLPEEDVEVIVMRRLICRDCPFNSINATKLGTYASAREDEHCIMCGCPIKGKTASLISNCGIEAYNGRNPNNQLPLKWERVDKTKTEDGK